VSDTFKVVAELRAAGVVLHTIADGVTIRPGADDVVSETLVFALSLAARLVRRRLTAHCSRRPCADREFV
jgi:hypothetical protein